MALAKGFQTFKQRGEWVELLFMTRAAERGFNVSTPYGDSARYDLSVEANGRFVRVQVKSTDFRSAHGYPCTFCYGRGVARYTVKQLDFFAAYVIPHNVWYIIRASVAVCMKGRLLLNPDRKTQKYRGIWKPGIFFLT